MQQKMIELKARLGASKEEKKQRRAEEETGGGLLSDVVMAAGGLMGQGKAGAPRRLMQRKNGAGGVAKSLLTPGAPDVATQAKTAAFLGYGDVGM